ncbi:pyridine nucleotide transhydrogenase [Franconibacter helveticus]|uniref:pyridine nucleotide transhydrogenase n=1 Tax=Franconibacter helveticus TaxID=357240 RepID=UPI0029124CBB|nr:pyridine nucleotide transhydrogenase [Franconibacter helveticus]MDU6923488.1 pyridine nucleotide transhydrogenase [Franconibacter helveticus]
MVKALIGYTGFVGTTLMKQTQFDEHYRSTNINDIKGKKFDLVVCAGAPAQKWIANADPQGDREKIDALISCLDSIECDTFILISTVDVFKKPVEVDENTVIDTQDLHAYGLNRYRLEQFVEKKFPRHLIVRLPGLIGPGLRKNIIYDFLNDNNVEKIESRSVFQFYPMVNLWFDIEKALDKNIRLIHLTAEPVSVANIAREGFGFEFSTHQTASPVSYDMRSIHGAVLGGSSHYQYSVKETLQAVRHYAQSEPKKIQEEKK